MKLESYISKLEQYNPNYNIQRIQEAYIFGDEAHSGQMRKSGEKFFIHPVHVSLILAELEMDEDTVIAGLLHDVIEDTEFDFDYVADKFGVGVAELVDGVTKLGKIHYESKEERQAENLRKMFLAMAKDIRVILIKLADRLHNMRTLKFMPDEKKKEKAQETLEIFAPVAHRLGISRIKWELEDLSLLYMDPEGYYDLVSKVNKRRDERESAINGVIGQLDENFQDSSISAEIYGRPKHFYSIYKKMKYQHKDFDEIFDLTAVRVIVDNVRDCYGVLGIVHTLWKPIPGRFKDYIAMPKPNMYQSLHTTVIGKMGEPFEIQIRTWEMHKIAEYGIAAHWKYKEGKAEAEAETEEGKETELEDKLSWLRHTMEWEKDMSSAQEFMDSLKFDLFQNQVFVFTPQGDVVELPAGSTPVDFAYKIHSAVGNRCVGAKVDGRIVPLNFKLTTGKIVEVLTTKQPHGPSRDWLKFVKSTQARNKIKHWFKKERREENIEKGKEMLERELKRNHFNPSNVLKADWMSEIIKRISVKDLDELYAAIGYGGIMINQVLPKVREKHKELQRQLQAEQKQQQSIEEQSVHVDKKKPRHNKGNQGVIVKGMDGILVRFAKCCSPVPGDEIIGYITRGRGVTVHRADCPNFETNEDTQNRFIEAHWLQDEQSAYQSEVQIVAPDRKGLLSEITRLIAETSVLVLGVNARRTKDEIAVINLTLEISNKDQLKQVMNKFKNMPDIIDVKRVIS